MICKDYKQRVHISIRMRGSHGDSTGSERLLHHG